MAQLTPNAISKMVELDKTQNFDAAQNFHPTVQVTVKRKVTAQDQERVKVEVSDGINSLPGILSSELARSPAAAELQRNDVILVDGWSIQKLQSKNPGATQGSPLVPYLIVVLGFSLVQRAPGKIGNPVKFTGADLISGENTAPVQQMGPPMQQSNASPYGAPPAGTYGQPPNGVYGQPPNGAYGQPSNGAYGQAPPGAYGRPPAGMSGQQQQQAAMPANSMYGAPAGGAYGQPASQLSSSIAGNRRGALPASLNRPKYDQDHGPTMHNSAQTNMIKISAISQYQARWTIRGRCSSKSELRRYNKNGKSGCVFNFDLLDSSGEVRVVAFGDAAEKYEPAVKMGAFYELGKATAKTMDSGKRKWNQTGHDCEVYLENNSELVEIQEEQPDVPKIHLKPVKLAEVEALPTETFVDVIAVLDTCQDLGLIQRRDGSEGKKRSMVVRDDSGRSIELTLWGEKAENVGAELFEHSRAGQHPVLVIKSARIGEFNGKNLSTVGSSMILVEDAAVPGVAEMQQWFASGGAAQPAQALSRTGGGRADRRATVSIIREEHLGTGGNAAWVKMVGTLAGVGSGDTLTYPACRLDFNGRQCNKKVQPGGDDSGLFFCSRCQQSCQPMYRYLLNLNLVDFTGGLEHVSVFGELGDTVMGMNADDAHENLEGENRDAFDGWLQRKVLWRPRAFKIKCSEDTYNEETRLKYTLQTCEEIDYATDGTKLCEMIDDLISGRPVKAMQPPPPKGGVPGGFPGGSPVGFGAHGGGMQAPGMMGMAQGHMGGQPMGAPMGAPMGGGFVGNGGMNAGMAGPMVGAGGFVGGTQGQWSSPGGGMAAGGFQQSAPQFQGQYNQMQGGQFQSTQQYGAPYPGMQQQGMPQQHGMHPQHGMPQNGMQPGMQPGMQQPNMAFIDQPAYGPR